MTTTHVRSDHDVLIIGAGPAGLSTALSASRHGARVLVVERHPGTSIHPRASGISTRTMEILAGWGVDGPVLAMSEGISLRTGIGETLTDPELVGARNGFPDEHEAREVSPTRPACLAQDVLEPLLVDQLRRSGGEVRFDTELLDVLTGPDGVEARVRNRATGAIRDVRARYLVGADGTRSSVRSALGIDVEHLGSAGEWAQVIFRAQLDPVLGPRRYGIYAIGHPEAGGLMLPFGPDRWGFARQWFPERGETFADFTPDRWTSLLRRATGVSDLRPELVDAMPFTLAAEVATSVRSGPAFLVGDAAHRMTPFGASGLNTAVADGHNLGWKLAWVARGLAGEALLDSYADERVPVGRRNTERSLLPPGSGADDRLGFDLGPVYRSTVIADDGPASPVVVPPSSAAARPGERAPHVWVSHHGRRFSTLELFGYGLTLVVGRHGDVWRSAAAAVSPAPAAVSPASSPAGVDVPPIRVVVAGADVVEPDGALTRAYRLGDAGAVLVRPDGHVAWRCDDRASRSDRPVDPKGELRRAVERTLGRSPARMPSRTAPQEAVAVGVW